MLDVFGAVQAAIKIQQTTIDNNVFRLHYKVRWTEFFFC